VLLLLLHDASRRPFPWDGRSWSRASVSPAASDGLKSRSTLHRPHDPDEPAPSELRHRRRRARLARRWRGWRGRCSSR